MSDSEFVAHFVNGKKSDDPFGTLLKILKDKALIANTVPFGGRKGNKVVCFTECPWASLLGHIKNYSPFGIGFSKPRVFAAGGGPAYYVRPDHFEKQEWDNHVKPFTTPFWPEYRDKAKNSTQLGGKTIDYSHEREWRVPHNFTFEYDQIEFVVLPDYVSMDNFPWDLKIEIGREKFILVEVYQQIEKLWPTHIVASHSR